MAVTAQLVKELRLQTDAPMMDCHKALVETNGDLEKAVDYLREKGQAKAAKKASRIAADGRVIVLVSDDAKRGVLLEVNCETDFVAKDENFVALGNEAAQEVMAQNLQTIEQLLDVQLSAREQTVEAARQTMVAKLGENIQFRRVASFSSEHALGHYSHGGRIGVIVEISGGDAELAKDIAMHIAAANPRFVAPEQVPEDVVNKEKEIFTAQAVESGKPKEIAEKMTAGRIKKFLAEICLEGQSFVKDPSMSVGQLLSSKGAKVVSFQRFELGEGIEKVETNFAEEVKATARGGS